jgi:hypothetical protein
MDPFHWEVAAVTLPGGCAGEEPEGLDYFDVGGRDQDSRGQLHVVKISNELFDDDLQIHHYLENNDLAQGRPTWQSSDFEPQYGSGRAVDGILDGDFGPSPGSHTGFDEYPQWRVDLDGKKTIHSIEIFNRSDCCANRLQEWSVWYAAEDGSWVKLFNDSRRGGAGYYTRIAGRTRTTTETLRARHSSGRCPAVAWPVRTDRILVPDQSPGEYLHLAVRIRGISLLRAERRIGASRAAGILPACRSLTHFSRPGGAPEASLGRARADMECGGTAPRHGSRLGREPRIRKRACLASRRCPTSVACSSILCRRDSSPLPARAVGGRGEEVR